ncbi:hypothetical protein LCI18_012506 [Fusarium solani-melongenae]|uniref:Uncharacterized protein n=1 Tax=Fusarium solani subsp. cucurbitae TaxID=2747967 RepID=A0ACD3ZL45_FUSSC|nr:hypothetical protein LCI18_012506 [Fusarium solani-melongenae]
MNPSEDPESISEFPVAALDLMPQQLEVAGPGDDWTGVTSARERRRRQNRLNQRTYRKRRAPGSSLSSETHPSRRENSSPGGFDLPTEARHQRWTRVSEHTSDSFACGIPTPLSLSMVIQLNAFNALFYNAYLLGIKTETLCDVKIMSPFTSVGSYTIDERCPSSLHPTLAQRTIHHHPWIDLLPLPRLRDNLIRAFQIINEQEIGSDIMSVQAVAGEKPTLIVWGDPSNPRWWEASPAFLLKWGYLLRGCQELIEATNYWRKMRGEKPFRIDVS